MVFELTFSTVAYDLYLVWMSLAPLLIVGAILSSVLHVVLPQNFIHNALNGRSGVWKAVLIGVPLPLCSCSVIPTGLGLKRDGASNGSTVGFLISTPQTGIDSIFVSASLLGLPFAIFKVIAAALTGLLGGYLTEALSDDDHVSKKSEYSVHPQQFHHGQTQWAKAISHFNNILEPIWGWVVMGVIVSVMIQYLIPAKDLSNLNGWSIFFPYVLTLGLSLPLYVCATASVPIAAALVAQGFPIGVALIFLMAGPATNIATLGAVYKGLGVKPFSIYLSTLIIGSISFALILDLLLGWQAPHSIFETNQHIHHFGWWENILAVLALFIFARYFIQWIGLIVLKTNRVRGSVLNQSIVEQQISLGISGLTCQGCVRRLESRLLQNEEITHCEVNSSLNQLSVSGTLNLNTLKTAVREAGFEALDEIK